MGAQRCIMNDVDLTFIVRISLLVTGEISTPAASAPKRRLHCGKERPSKCVASPSKKHAKATCSCRSNGKAARWLSLYLNSPPSIPTNPPRKPSATGITGWLRVTCSKFLRAFHMNQRPSKSQPKWTHVKAKLTRFDRPALLGLIQDPQGQSNVSARPLRFGRG